VVECVLAVLAAAPVADRPRGETLAVQLQAPGPFAVALFAGAGLWDLRAFGAPAPSGVALAVVVPAATAAATNAAGPRGGADVRVESGRARLRGRLALRLFGRQRMTPREFSFGLWFRIWGLGFRV